MDGVGDADLGQQVVTRVGVRPSGPLGRLQPPGQRDRAVRRLRCGVGVRRPPAYDEEGRCARARGGVVTDGDGGDRPEALPAVEVATGHEERGLREPLADDLDRSADRGGRERLVAVEHLDKGHGGERGEVAGLGLTLGLPSLHLPQAEEDGGDGGGESDDVEGEEAGGCNGSEVPPHALQPTSHPSGAAGRSRPQTGQTT
jgi:hypothetical protein